MKTKIKISKKEVRNYTVVFVVGIIFGWMFFHNSGNNIESEHKHDQQEEVSITWTCSMHPQIKMDKPGKCPLCGMDLIPLDLSSSDEEVSPNEIQMTEAAMKIADIQTIEVRKDYSNKEVYLLGKVKPDERNIAELTARFGGRMEKLFVNFTGQNVVKGEKLATIYSPELVTAQKELLEAIEYKESNPAFYRATRNKLKLWDLNDEQIKQIEENGEPQHYFNVLSPITGTVTMRHVSLGDYVKEGSALFQVIDLRKIWVMFEAYESDLPWLSHGDHVVFNIQSIPGKTYSGLVAYIDPFINAKTRIANVRLEVENPNLELKPEMYVNGIVHPKMSGNKKDLLIPKTSVLWTGKRSVVYVKVPDRNKVSFLYREITLGPDAGEFYIVIKGLEEGEIIAMNGVFKIDAAAQLAGKPSMMNPERGVKSTGHNHGGMEMGSKSSKIQDHSGHVQSSKPIKVDSKFVMQITDVYNNYLDLKDGFVATDSKLVAEKAKSVKALLKKVDMKLLKGDAHMKWMDQLKPLNDNLEKIVSSDDIDIQRSAFADFNLAYYNCVKTFGLKDITTYYQYCPMADRDKGAYWFSETKKIKNPYFGEAMLGCGETREVFE